MTKQFLIATVSVVVMSGAAFADPTLEQLHGYTVSNAGGIEVNSGNISKNTTGILNNTAAIEAEKGRNDTQDGLIADNTDAIERVHGQTVSNAGGIEVNSGNISKNTTEIKNNTTSIAQTVERINTAFERIDTNWTAIQKNQEAVTKNTAAIAHNSNRIDTLEGEIDGLKGGVAMAIAIANAPIVTNGTNKFSLAGGMGYYEDAFALSIKGAFMPTDNIAITGSVATDLQDSFSAGAGVGFAF